MPLSWMITIRKDRLSSWVVSSPKGGDVQVGPSKMGVRSALGSVLGFVAVGLFGVLLVGSIVIGPGGVVAAFEYPFSAGPWGPTGRSCHQLYDLGTNLRRYVLSPTQATTQAIRSEVFGLKQSGQKILRTDMSNYVSAIQTNDNSGYKSAISGINSWWIGNCQSVDLKAPGFLNRLYSGFMGGSGVFYFQNNMFQ